MPFIDFSSRSSSREPARTTSKFCKVAVEARFYGFINVVAAVTVATGVHRAPGRGHNRDIADIARVRCRTELPPKTGFELGTGLAVKKLVANFCREEDRKCKAFLQTKKQAYVVQRMRIDFRIPGTLQRRPM
jgi:hypothetical protein